MWHRVIQFLSSDIDDNVLCPLYALFHLNRSLNACLESLKIEQVEVAVDAEKFNLIRKVNWIHVYQMYLLSQSQLILYTWTQTHSKSKYSAYDNKSGVIPMFTQGKYRCGIYRSFSSIKWIYLIMMCALVSSTA